MSGGVHRVPVIDPSTKRIVKIISQSDIVQFLSLHLDELGSKVDRTVRELGLGSRPVIAVAANASPLEAFQMMAERRLSALPVVHPMTGQIVTNVSASDVKVSAANMLGWGCARGLMHRHARSPAGHVRPPQV